MSKCCYDQLREKCCLELVPKWFRPVTLFTSRKPLRQYKTRPKIDSHLSGYGQSRIIFAGESGEEEKRQIPSCQSALKPPVCSISEDIITLQPSDCFHQEAPGCLCETHTDRHILYRIPTHTHTHTLAYCQPGHQDILEILHIARLAIGWDAGSFLSETDGWIVVS